MSRLMLIRAWLLPVRHGLLPVGGRSLTARQRLMRARYCLNYKPVMKRLAPSKKLEEKEEEKEKSIFALD